MRDVGLKGLEAVLAIARLGSFRAAAIHLEMSTTALSHAVGRLEAGLGVRLFNRTTRSVSLTDAGRRFVARVAPALTEISAAAEEVRSQRVTPSGLIRINASPTGARAVAPLVFDFLRRCPDMHVDLVTEGRLVDIVADGFDLGVRTADLVPRDMIALALGEPQRYAVVVAPDWLERHPAPLSPADLAPEDCLRVRLPNGAIFPWRFEKDGQVVLVDAGGGLTSDEASITRAAARAGAGIAFTFEREVIEDVESGRLVRLLEDWTPPRPGFCLYYSGRRNPSAGFSAFLALARERAGRQEGAGPAAGPAA